MSWPIYTEVDGYEELRPDGGRGVSNQRGIRHHRLLAYLYGQLDSLDDPREVDHLIPIPWLNYEANLEAVDTAEHTVRTNRRAAARKATAENATLDEYGDDAEAEGVIGP